MLSYYQNRTEQKREDRDHDVYYTAGHAFFGALSRWRGLLVVVYGAGALLPESCCEPIVCKTERGSKAFS